MASFRPSLKTGKNMAGKRILIRQGQIGLPRVFQFCENLFSPTDSWRPTDCLNQKNQSAGLPESVGGTNHDDGQCNTARVRITAEKTHLF